MSDLEIRAASVGAANKKLVGYVVRWNSDSEVIWNEFIEMFSPGAFTDALNSGDDIRALFEHDHRGLLGRTTSGTLKLEEDATGLRFEIDPPDTSLGRDLLVSVERGDITGMSFGFRAKEESWNFDTEPARRTVIKADLFEITVTSIPAYKESDVSIALRSMAAAQNKDKPVPGDELRRRYLELEEASL
ncbi:HK97 family phage prohead protease [Vibrio crassostreae]|uniref:HK97 family phage prohead protease n=1 Tax=Vibrio crassostreae TaxID=246167 RepID=UPI0010513071|nr:HK97 family phage prohead protease [Vibrio crassostreae]TCT41983.1 hypothetical protein EDB39_13419 [Vibrio crassostreae]TCT47700.1 hypothetical protein EDB40_1332 [Vibrio crassostreae]CAK2103704.1 Peptidase [Vibrio crassostreae]CAK2108180.1 Peptidase [Vibrio crassostreae]CAK2109558.1 Peptidase [Vibrio crassostreae]